MQAQQTRTTTLPINHTQSLAAVQTVLKAGLGAIAYLRNLLPEDNFSPCHFTSSNETESFNRSFELNNSQDSTDSRRGPSGFRIMTLTRGYTDEADKILNYLEYGIFDALEKRYLRSFIFAIYLDSKDPTNIVEAYTFNFKYHTVPGTGLTIPIMTLDHDLQRLSLKSKKRCQQEDAVAKAIKDGKTPTLKDVKTSVKKLLKNLYHAMHSMDNLPRRRYATFKVFYTDETPLDYEPPHFHAGDADKDKWYFMTHDFDEVPDTYSIGAVATGHHSVNLTVTSIASYLPSSNSRDDVPFGGMSINPGKMILTPLQDASLLKIQAEQQLKDAETRNLVWSADECIDVDEDAEGEDDPDYTIQTDRIKTSPAPIGVRGAGGVVDPLSKGDISDDAQYGGISERVPTKLQEMAAERVQTNTCLEETQAMSLTPPNKAVPSSLSPWSNDREMLSPFSRELTTPSTRTTSPDPGILNALAIRPLDNSDAEMLDLETQISQQKSSEMEPIESFGSLSRVRAKESIDAETPIDDNGLRCECEIDIEDECCLCEGGCKRWFHIWCMGYHSIKDSRMPATFLCFDCRVRSDMTWELIKSDLYPQMLSKFKDLALFRRAIKVAEFVRSFTPVQFYKAFGCDAILGTRMIRRLEDEEFILKESATLDELGLKTTSRLKTKGKAKQVKLRKNLQKTQYSFDFSTQTKAEYCQYFSPDDQAVESNLLGLPEMAKKAPAKVLTIDETQTQEDTQLVASHIHENGSKRTMPQAELDNSMISIPFKKIKISVAFGVDLAD